MNLSISLNTNNTITGNQNNNNFQYNVKDILLSFTLFIVSGILEVGGGYLIWISIREKKKPEIFIPIGCILLMMYGFAPTLQPMTSFGRIFAIYGGFFIMLSYIWAVIFDNFKLDLGDIIGTSIALCGVCVCWFWPRN